MHANYILEKSITLQLENAAQKEEISPWKIILSNKELTRARNESVKISPM